MKADILIVDDNETFLLSLVEGLRIHDEELNILAALNGKEAIKILTSASIDLLITDLKMPVMDGFELLAYMGQHFPNIPVIVITAFGTPEIEHLIDKKGAYMYLEKPLDFNLMVEKIYEGLEAKSDGYLTEIFLPSFLQLLEIEKKSCLLTVNSQGRVGHLYFREGELIHAESGSETGVNAACTVIAWEESVIEIKSKFKKAEKTIEQDLSFILMECMRQKDETQKFKTLGLKKKAIQGESPESKIDESKTSKPKEVKMGINVKKLQEAIEALKENVGAGLIASDIWSSHDGQSLVGFNPQPKACALFNQITNYLIRSLKDSGFPALGRLYTVELVDNKLIIVLSIKEFQWGMLVDTTKTTLGLILNIAVPQAIKQLEESIGE